MNAHSGDNDRPAGLDDLAALSRRFGRDEDFVIAAGGNTSLKTDGVIYVKASGRSLANVTVEDFVAMDRGKLDALLREDFGFDAGARRRRFNAGLLAARTNPDCPLRPSVESLMHNFLPGMFVVHTHPTLVGAVACCRRGRQITREIFGAEVIYVPWAEPGLDVARVVASAVENYARQYDAGPRAIILENHGFIVAADAAEEIETRTDRIISAIEDYLKNVEAGRPFGLKADAGERGDRELVETLKNLLQTLLARGGVPKAITFDNSSSVRELVCGADGASAALCGPVTPHQVIYCGALPMWFELRADENAGEMKSRLRRSIGDYTRRHGAVPVIVLARGLGMFAAGDDSRRAEVAAKIYRNTAEILAWARRLGGIKPIGDETDEVVGYFHNEGRRMRRAAGDTGGQ